MAFGSEFGDTPFAGRTGDTLLESPVSKVVPGRRVPLLPAGVRDPEIVDLLPPLMRLTACSARIGYFFPVHAAQPIYEYSLNFQEM